MALDKDPWEINAQDVRKAKADGKYDDCLACRVTGSAALIGLGGYTLISGLNHLQKEAIKKSRPNFRLGPRRLGVFSLSATLVAMGIWRAIN